MTLQTSPGSPAFLMAPAKTCRTFSWVKSPLERGTGVVVTFFRGALTTTRKLVRFSFSWMAPSDLFDLSKKLRQNNLKTKHQNKSILFVFPLTKISLTSASFDHAFSTKAKAFSVYILPALLENSTIPISNHQSIG